MGELGRTEQIHGNGDNDRKRQHGKGYAMTLTHAKGGTDIAGK